MASSLRGIAILLLFRLTVTGLAFVGLCGCERRMPSWETPVSHVPGVESPSERIKAMRALAAKAPATTDPGQRDSICVDLANQIRKEEDSILRGEILRTLAAYGGPTADNVLHAGVTDPDSDVRLTVCGIWGKRGNAEAAQCLESMLASDTDKDVRMAAARALGHCRQPDAVRALGSALDDSDPAMQNQAMLALRENTGKDLGSDIGRWREYVKNGDARPAETPSLAGRLFGSNH